MTSARQQLYLQHSAGDRPHPWRQSSASRMDAQWACGASSHVLLQNVRARDRFCWLDSRRRRRQRGSTPLRSIGALRPKLRVHLLGSHRPKRTCAAAATPSHQLPSLAIVLHGCLVTDRACPCTHRSWSPWLAVSPSDKCPAWMRYIALLLPPPAHSRPHANDSNTSSRVSATLGHIMTLL